MLKTRHRMAECPYCNPKPKVIYDDIPVTIHDEGYDGVWVHMVAPKDSGNWNVLFTEPDVKFSSKVGRATEKKEFRYRLTLVEDFDG